MAIRQRYMQDCFHLSFLFLRLAVLLLRSKHIDTSGVATDFSHSSRLSYLSCFWMVLHGQRMRLLGGFLSFTLCVCACNSPVSALFQVVFFARSAPASSPRGITVSRQGPVVLSAAGWVYIGSAPRRLWSLAVNALADHAATREEDGTQAANPVSLSACGIVADRRGGGRERRIMRGPANERRKRFFRTGEIASTLN